MSDLMSEEWIEWSQREALVKDLELANLALLKFDLKKNTNPDHPQRCLVERIQKKYAEKR